MITDEQRSAFVAALGKQTYSTAVQIFMADFLPRVRAGLTALGLPVEWDQTPAADVDAAAVLFAIPARGGEAARAGSGDHRSGAVAQCFRAHDCRLCKSLREGTALDAGGSESLYDDVDSYESSVLLTDAHKAALRYTDALIWSPTDIAPDIAADVVRHFTPEQVRELTLDVMRNASNKIAVALAADAPHVEQGTERYIIDADGQTVFTSRSA